MTIASKIKDIVADILRDGKDPECFLGHPFYIDYNKSHILIADFYKNKVGGIPQGTFLLAFYNGEDNVSEALLLRAIRPTKLPTDNDVVSSMIEYYKDNLNISNKKVENKTQIDQFTRYEFSFSGIECRILGTFYKVRNDKGQEILEFGADVENFYSANNYSVYKATGSVLQQIVNQRTDDDFAGSDNEFRIGLVRYSSSRRFQLQNGLFGNDDKKCVQVFINPRDFLGKRTALFGMTRTGKSNTVKKIIQATVQISKKAQSELSDSKPNDNFNIESFDNSGAPLFPVGQIIFDVNGEYANPNLQDRGTAIYEIYKKSVTRYSVLDKPGFEVMKINFYKDIYTGFELISSHFKVKKENLGYLNNFLAISLEKPNTEEKEGVEEDEDKVNESDDFDEKDPEKGENFDSKKAYDRKLAAYLCCLERGGFIPPEDFKVYFRGNKELNKLSREVNPINPSKGISLKEAAIWFEKVWENYETCSYTKDYPKNHGREWADEDLKALLIFLSNYRSPGKKNFVSGYKKLRLKELHDLHTIKSEQSFDVEIENLLRAGQIVIVDLSQGLKEVQTRFSEKICQTVFQKSMERFIQNLPNNFIQFYFEEAHNLFPKKDDKNLSQIYNRIAKEGAKLQLALLYATQEVSSISSNILKNTQNWFIAHLNNSDELKEIEKFYDFSDFCESLIRFSSQDKGFVRMKTYSNPFVVPVQIDRFSEV
jgi:hypothetical protein